MFPAPPSLPRPPPYLPPPRELKAACPSRSPPTVPRSPDGAPSCWLPPSPAGAPSRRRPSSLPRPPPGDLPSSSRLTSIHRATTLSFANERATSWWPETSPRAHNLPCTEHPLGLMVARLSPFRIRWCSTMISLSNDGMKKISPTMITITTL
uniref:Uncharacterized protein n=1 Tax=Arundo donax TaxID=35708 RepID=A0A0A9HGE2_ARUDO